jgi:hypothetical protein
MKRDQSNTILSLLIFSIAIMLSGNVFAAKNYATQSDIDAAIANEDSTLKALISAQQTIIDAQQKTLNNAVADIIALKAAIAPKKIGDLYQGGKIFYIDNSGLHGLVAALTDQSVNIQWYTVAARSVGATGNAVGAGALNTSLIVAAQMADNLTGNIAAKIAADFSVQDNGLTACNGAPNEICRDDWYLPSKYELNLLYQQQVIVGGFAYANYWSSTEADSYDAWFQLFGNGFGNGTQNGGSKTNAHNVRVIRAF